MVDHAWNLEWNYAISYDHDDAVQDSDLPRLHASGLLIFYLTTLASSLPPAAAKTVRHRYIVQGMNANGEPCPRYYRVNL